MSEAEKLTETPKAKKARRSTESLLQSEVVNERFAGIVRKMSDVLRKPQPSSDKMNEKDLKELEAKNEATDKLYRVRTSGIVAGILKVKEPLLFADTAKVKNEYVPKLKGIVTDLAFENKDGSKGRKTVEMETFYKELADKFKVEKTGSKPKFVMTADFKLF